MITVEVVSVSGTAPSRPQSASFDDFGGTIGRAPDCTLVLQDDKRAVSRVHARITFRDGQCHVEDEGTNPLRVNGSPVGKGNMAPLNDGDQLSIGPYDLLIRMDTSMEGLAVETAFPPVEDANPFAGLLGSSPAPGPAASPFADLGIEASPSPASSSPFDDLGFGAAPAAPSSPAPSSAFDDPAFGAPRSAPAAPPSSSSSPFGDFDFAAPPPQSRDRSPSAGGGIPLDFDVMAPPPAAPSQEPLLTGGPSGLPDDFGSFHSAPDAPGSGSLDALFGLSSGAQADPFAHGALGKPSNSGGSPSGGTTNDSGLTKWLGGIAPAASAPVQDQVPEINAAFTPPRAVAPPPPPPPPAPPPLRAAPPPELPRRAAPPPAPPPAPRRPEATRPSRPPAPAPRPRASSGSSAELVEALLAGLDAQDLQIDELTPELMHRLGVLLHEATRGTLALLVARGTVKRELRADVTMISSGRNNPLKFSPDARIAMRYLLGPQMPGFMESEEAMRDAYNDLRAHEFGFMAGMRAALTGVIKRFAPEQIEARLPEKGGVAGLLQTNRRARLWDMFSEHYRQMTLEAEEDFQALFGREFLRAYEEHVSAIHQQGQGRR